MIMFMVRRIFQCETPRVRIDAELRGGKVGQFSLVNLGVLCCHYASSPAPNCSGISFCHLGDQKAILCRRGRVCQYSVTNIYGLGMSH